MNIQLMHTAKLTIQCCLINREKNSLVMYLLGHGVDPKIHLGACGAQKFQGPRILYSHCDERDERFKGDQKPLDLAVRSSIKNEQKSSHRLTQSGIIRNFDASS